MSHMIVRCVIPRFAQYIARSSAFTISVVPKSVAGHILKRQVSVSFPKQNKETINIYFIDRDGERLAARSTVGKSFLDAAIDNHIELEGACEGTLACSTCHLIFDKNDYNKLPNPPTDEELDMLDLAYGISDTSRLGCQIIVTKDMEGLTVRIPAGVADARKT